ncbi:MAG: hypothetical protein ABF785_03075 [Acetobacter papayae]|uniref:hypothetical protein n=1 Tax=Acetobacter papayae TaxID=1076592 RepID=UPI0039E826D8
MSATLSKQEILILRGFQKVCRILEKENDFLATMKFQKITDLLPVKRKEIADLEKALAERQKIITATGRNDTPLPTETVKIAQEFKQLIALNEKRLQQAINTQNTVIQLILDAAQESVTGYAASGHYAPAYKAQGAVTLRNDV